MLSIDKQSYNVRVFNKDFLLLENQEPDQSNTLIGEAILKANLPFISEVIATEVEICIKLNDLFKIDSLKALENISTDKNSKISEYFIPVCFEQEYDWKLIEESSSISKSDYINKLLDLEFSIAMFGFLPGFVYLNGLDESMYVPRKSNPSKRVPENSIAVGGKYLGFYSLSSPGGWNVIGRSAISLLNLNELPPVQMQSSSLIRLKEISLSEYKNLKNKNLSLSDYNGQS